MSEELSVIKAADVYVSDFTTLRKVEAPVRPWWQRPFARLWAYVRFRWLLWRAFRAGRVKWGVDPAMPAKVSGFSGIASRERK